MTDGNPTRAGSASTPGGLSREQIAVAWSIFAPKLPPFEDASDPMKEWFTQVVQLFVPAPEQFPQLPAAASFLFGFDVEQAHAQNASLLTTDSARIVLTELGDRARVRTGPVTAELFHQWLAEITIATGVAGPALLSPVTIAITGSPTGPKLENLIPLIENGASLGLPIPSVCERIEKFVGV